MYDDALDLAISSGRRYHHRIYDYDCMHNPLKKGG